MVGLKCLLTSRSQIQLIGDAMRAISDAMITGNANAQVTVRAIHSQLKKAGVDIDMESTAAIYSDVFANDMNQYSNFESDETIKEYAKVYPPVSKAVKDALIKAGYSTETKAGATILDWTKLMRKSEQEIRDEIKGKNLPNEDDIFNSLQSEWKQIVSTALIKARNDLSRRNEDVSPSQRTAIDKIADLHVKGLFADFKDDYTNAIHKAIGTSRETLDDLDLLNQIAGAARLLQQTGMGTNNYVGQYLQNLVNSVIAKARYRDANWFYKFTKSLSNLFEFVSLAILNNLGNRSQNYFSGQTGRVMSAVQYGLAPREVQKLAKLLKRDIIRGGGMDFGEVSNAFNGDRRAVDALREMMTTYMTEDGSAERVTNWVYNQLMGVAALNGVDNYLKVKNTWTRFVAGAEDILVSKGISKEDARKTLNQELFGDSWEKARIRATAVMNDIKAKGGFITVNEDTIERFTADIVKAQLIENNILTTDQLTGAWKAAYTSAGLEMGHVSNNIITRQLNSLKEYSQKNIEEALTNREYTKAGFLVLGDMFTSKMIYRFMGGGSNWLVLKLEKAGLGLIMGIPRKLLNGRAYRGMQNLSTMTAQDIEKTLSTTQEINDQIARGTVGTLANAAILLLAQAAFGVGVGGCNTPECEEKKEKILDWMERNRWSTKYVNNLVPAYLTAYIAWQKQKRIGVEEVVNFRRYSPARSYAYNFFNAQEETTVEKLIQGSAKLFSDDDEKRDEGLGQIGESMGQYFNLDPIPYRPWKDAWTMYQGLQGNIKQTNVRPRTIWEGYLRFGITDWPKLKSAEDY